MYKSVILRSWIMLPVLYGQNFASRFVFVQYILGDLVNNNLNLFPAIKQMMELLPVQSWTVIGNHDRDADSIRINQTFHIIQLLDQRLMLLTKETYILLF